MRDQNVMGTVDMSEPIGFKIDGLDLELNLETGKILNAENPDWDQYCMNPSKLSIVQGVFRDKEVCRTEIDVQADLFCAQVYTFPYVDLVMTSGPTRIELGEANSACPDVITELCQEDETAKNLINRLDFRNDFFFCDNGTSEDRN